jgi:glutamate-1-semialdehyde 2,1-aminomutase
MLIRSGSGLAEATEPDSAGLDRATLGGTLVAGLDDEAALDAIFAKHGGEIACAIIEPLPANYGLLIQRVEFLRHLATQCRKHGALLILDEVISGFRVGFTGCAGLYGIEPDLVTYGKVIGGGFPVGAYGGKREIMQHMSPVGPIYQAGTLSGNPLAMTAGITTLEILRAAPPYAVLGERTAHLMAETARAAKRHNVPVHTAALGSMFTLFFSHKPVRNFEDASACDIPAFCRYFAHMLQAGIYLAPSQFEAGFLSTAHTEVDIEDTLRAGAAALQAV